jgi:4-hydroxy-tetrahydrodipicolinate reductase
MTENLKVIVAGYMGRMGKSAVNMVLESDDLELSAVFDPFATEESFENVPVYKNSDEIPDGKFDVWIDFTTPAAVFENVKLAISKQIAPVVGTTGLTDEQVAELNELAKKENVSGLIAPNFAIGAVLMMKFAATAAKYFPDVEVIEMHHDKKLDAPSGTALKTVEMMKENRTYKMQGHPDEKETISGARGAEVDGMRIHSVRLPGLIAHQQVQFGGVGEGLIIRHDSYDRISFMTGVHLACTKVKSLNGIGVGLENVL